MTKVLKVLNHALTDEQAKALNELYDERVIIDDLPKEFATFLQNTPGNERRLYEEANALARYIARQGYDAVILPAGSPAFMFLFARASEDLSVAFLFAHSERQVVEKKRPDGSVEKTSTFKFVKWIRL